MSYSHFQCRAGLMYGWAGIRLETYCSSCKCKPSTYWKIMHWFQRRYLSELHVLFSILFYFFIMNIAWFSFFLWIKSTVFCFGFCLFGFFLSLFSFILHKHQRNTFPLVSDLPCCLDWGAFALRSPHYWRQPSPAHSFMAPHQKRSSKPWQLGFFSLSVLSE